MLNLKQLLTEGNMDKALFGAQYSHDPDILHKLSSHKEREVRMRVADNPHTSNIK